MSRSRKILMTLGVLGVSASVTGVGTFSAFSGTTENTGNSFAAGTVVLGDNDGGTALYNVSNKKPGEHVESCIKVTYTGTLAADVKLYAPDAIGTLGPYVDLSITPGTGNITGTSCTGFVADSGGALYSGTLGAFRTTHGSYAAGLSDHPGTTATQWVANDAVVYKVRVTLQDDDAAQGLTTGTHALKWEARNK